MLTAIVLVLSLTACGSSSQTITGYIDGQITNVAGSTVSTETGTVSVTLEAGSTWTLTADSYVTAFDGSAADVIGNGHTLYVNGAALEGTN